MEHLMKKASIAIMAAVIAAAICLSMMILPSKAYADTTYAIGDTGPAGGIIFYVNGSDYLEAAPSDQSTGIRWYNGSYIVTGATATAIGNGFANTNTIISVQGATATSYAAGLARAYTGGGYSDWFLPSSDELTQMYINRVAIGGFSVTSWYWSSSESDSGNALEVMFSDGTLGITNKDVNCRVRAIRAFSVIKETAIEPIWVRTQEMTCKQVWINEDNKFQFSFIYPYRDNNWVKIYDMGGKEVFSIDMPYDNPNIIVDLPDGMYTVKTFNDQPEPIQTFIIGKP
jgi:hypothetical protein